MTQEELAAKHDTPIKFAVALRKAHEELLITEAEMIDALDKYNEEWLAAGTAKTSVKNNWDAFQEEVEPTCVVVFANDLNHKERT